MYCPSYGTVLAVRYCVPGYYCPSGTSNPTDDASLICPIGHSCPQGSSSPVPCAPGSYSYQVGRASCDPCPVGYFCNDPEGTVIPADCRKGSKCEIGASSIHVCEPGYYQDSDNSGECRDCPEGYYCDAPSGTINPKECPLYSYCPSNTASPILCEDGSYGDTTKLTSSSDCTPCDPGKYCTNGKISGYCSPGYLCRQGAKTSNPSVAIQHMNHTKDIQIYLLSLSSAQCPPNYYVIIFYNYYFHTFKKN